MGMKRLSTRMYLALLIVLASPVACFAADPDGGDSILEWIIRFIVWSAGGWHGL